MKVFARDVIMNLTIRHWIVSQAFLFKLTIIWVICKKKKKNSKVEKIARWNIREGEAMVVLEREFAHENS